MALQKREHNSEQDSLLGVIETLFKWKKQIIICCIATAVLSAVVSLILPVFYKGTTTFYAASADLAAPERIFGEINSDAMDYYGNSEDIDRVITIAKSNELVDFMIDSFNLYERYDITMNEKAPYYVRQKFFELYNIKQTKYDALELSVEDKDKELAAQMANTARQKISEILSRLIKDSQRSILKTYTSSIFEGEKNLSVVNDTLRAMREKYMVYNAETQSEGISSAMTSAKQKLVINEIELAELKKQGRVHRDTVIKRNAIIEATRRQIQYLEEQLGLFNAGMAKVSYLETLQEEAADELAKDKERLKKYQSALAEQFPTVHIVETAKVPIIKSRPIRWLIVAASTIVAFILSVIAILLIDAYKDVNWQAIINGK